MTINIGELIDPYSTTIKVKLDKEYVDFNLKGYVINPAFDLRKFIKEVEI